MAKSFFFLYNGSQHAINKLQWQTPDAGQFSLNVFPAGMCFVNLAVRFFSVFLDFPPKL